MNYRRTKIGKTLYSLVMKWGRWVDKHSPLYYFLMCTWGVLETIIGLFVFLFMLITGHLPHKNHKGFYFMFGSNWGGFSVGLTQVVANDMGDVWTSHTIHHECGHSYQMTLFGPFWFFFVAIPSQVRWCIDTYKANHNLKRIDYDAVWFEGSATDLGEELVK